MKTSLCSVLYWDPAQIIVMPGWRWFYGVAGKRVKSLSFRRTSTMLPRYPLRDLTDGEKRWFNDKLSLGYVKYEDIPCHDRYLGPTSTGRYFTQSSLEGFLSPETSVE